MRFSRKSLGIPYAVFLVIFVAACLLFLFYYAFTNGQGQFTLQNFTHFFTDPNTLGTLYYSFSIALVTTLVCLLLAYPTAYILATSGLRAQSVLLMLFVMPMWINFSLRITALKEILNVLEGNLALHPFFNAVIGMTYDFMPFMILPIYTTISRLDPACYDKLCRSRHAVQQHIYHGKPYRQLFRRIQLARRLHDLSDPACHDLHLHPADVR